MATSSRLDTLPEELLLHIMSFLQPCSIINLQSVSKYFLRVCRDNSFWRIQCLSSYAEKRLARLGITTSTADHGEDTTSDQDDESAQPVDWGLIGNTSILRSKNQKEHVRMIANWDPTFPNESINWYDEYIHRNGPTAVNWFERPPTSDQASGSYRDVKGCALYQSSASHDILAVSPLDDGSICLWDVKGTRGRAGAILSTSVPGLLNGEKSIGQKGVDPVECVSVDSQRNRAFFAIERRLVEVDLEKLAVVSQWPFEWSIHTISTAQPSIPLTVGTTLGLHLFDHRAPTDTPAYAPLAQPGPISVLHMEQPGNKAQISDDIFVAGRFSNILHYDRRVFPTIKGSIHSGASLCGLTSLPYPFSWSSSELRRSFQLTEEEIHKDKSKNGRTLVACGEYNTKGSIEMYGLGEPEPGQGASQHTFQTSTQKNRQTAASSKLLSVINHGTRLVFSDGTGYLKWLERDGFTEVRRLKLGKSERFVQHSIFRTMPGSDELALKLLSTNAGASDENFGTNADDILFWTGDKLGLVNFSAKEGFFADEFEATSKTPEELELEGKQNQYNEEMRQALERQAVDAYHVQQLGAGSIHTGF